MGEREYKVGDLYNRNHFKHQKINGEWRYWYEDDPSRTLNKKTKTATQDEDMAACNPKYSKGGVYKNNCISCALAYDLRRRGYDVESVGVDTTKAANGSLSVQLGFYKGEKLQSFDVPDDPNIAVKQFTKELLKYGNGSRGMLRIRWKNGDGHAAIWEVEDNSVIIRDPQNNTIVDLMDYMKRAKTFYYFRTDNLELTSKATELVRSSNKSGQTAEMMKMSAPDLNTLVHYGVPGMRWGVRRFQNKSGSLTTAGKKRYSEGEKKPTSSKGETVFNTLKKGANAALDKASSDNFFNSDSIFSEKSMKTQSRINRTRDFINSVDYKTLTSKGGSKRLMDAGKAFIQDSLDDADSRSFFNDDWDTRTKKQERNDFIRDLIDD